MTEAEINRVLRAKWPSHHPEARRKTKLKLRYPGERLDAAIAWTRRRLELLEEIRNERAQPTHP